MFIYEDLFQKNEKKISELEIKHHSLNREIEELLASFGATLDQVVQYVEQKDNFTSEQWNLLQEEKHKLNNELLTKMSHLSDPRKTIKNRQELSQASSWIQVR